MEIKVQITGQEGLIKAVENATGITQDAIKDAVLKTAFDIEADAKDLAPVDTGRLRASITINYTNSGYPRATITQPAQTSKADDAIGQPPEEQGQFTAVIGTNVEYGRYIEYGFARHLAPVGDWPRRHKMGNTRVMYVKGVAKPYLYPALAKNQDKLQRRLKIALEGIGK